MIIKDIFGKKIDNLDKNIPIIISSSKNIKLKNYSILGLLQDKTTIFINNNYLDEFIQKSIFIEKNKDQVVLKSPINNKYFDYIILPKSLHQKYNQSNIIQKGEFLSLIKEKNPWFNKFKKEETKIDKKEEQPKNYIYYVCIMIIILILMYTIYYLFC